MMNAKHIFEKIEETLKISGIGIQRVENDRPWGGFFVLNEADAGIFISNFFPEINKNDLIVGAKLSPKILLVEPGKKLSWQYHHRRAEIWKLIEGTAAVVTSDTDVEKETRNMIIGEIIQLSKGERHRLIGLNEWGIVAEIWMHTDPVHPSNEEDIIRIQDDFGRN